MTDAHDALALSRGPALPNRMMLAPLTNLQSHADGTLSEDEFIWLTKRAQGGFGLTMTCAAHVQAIGQGFPGQLGIFSDEHLPGLTRLASALNAEGGVSSVQLHHAGMRSPAELIGEAPVSASEQAEFGARALSGEEVEAMIEAFIRGAERAEAAGFHGVELHGAHGYLLCQFLSAETNRREDPFGGTLAKRMRPLLQIIDGIRARCAPTFQLGVRLSPERFGMTLDDATAVAQRLLVEEKIDYLDLSLWDVRKKALDAPEVDLIDPFMALPRGRVAVGVAGKINSGEDVRYALGKGADFVLLGRAAILHHDFPKRLAADENFQAATLPVTRAHLVAEGLGPKFVDYMATWKGFVEEA
jgi:2,4-dienoyl-CoA reductase-like NADH-dependent reductase (Old Yellow Enzyme family)